MKLTRIFLIFWILSVTTVSGQSDLLKGKLIDALTEEPVAFATVAVKSKTVGVISNYDGSFSVPQRFEIYGDTLEISCMGFETRKISISTLSVDKVRTLYLEPAVFELEETVVKAKNRRLSAKQIVRRAIANIPNNYPNRLSSTVGYYRDYQLKEDNYVNLNEAILEVFDQGFSTVDTLDTKVQIYDYKRNNDFERDTLADDQYDYKRLQKIVDNAYLSGYGGNEFAILRVHDAIRNYNLNSYSFVNRFDSNLLKNHFFFRDNSTYINDEAVYTIRFQKTYPNYTAHGKLYISHGDFAIHKMEYTLYDDRKKRPDGSLNKHNGHGQLLFDVVTEYRRKYNRMYLNYISFHNSFILWEPPKFKIDSILIDLKYERDTVLRNGSFKVLFNKTPQEAEAVKRENYKVRFNGKRLKIGKVVVFENSVSLFLDMAQKEKGEMLVKLAENEKNSVELSKILSIDVEPIHDLDGNVLNKWEKRDYSQFREYFVQQIKPNSTMPSAVEFMNNRKPIFKDQPIVRPENFDDYWMNTPLQNVKD